MLPYDLPILFPDVYPTEMCTCDHPETGVFIAVLFVIALETTQRIPTVEGRKKSGVFIKWNMIQQQ